MRNDRATRTASAKFIRVKILIGQQRKKLLAVPFADHVRGVTRLFHKGVVAPGIGPVIV